MYGHINILTRGCYCYTAAASDACYITRITAGEPSRAGQPAEES